MRAIRQAEIVSVGSELTVGETRDTNSGELAGSLTSQGVEVLRTTVLPDDLPIVRTAFEAALERADLVVSTGGLGPTPDDLTREAIAAAVGETPSVDPVLETWLRGLFARRSVTFPAPNLKQAWVLPSVTPIPNDNGTAPGWWVDRPDGRVIVALPGPPRELRPMWVEWVLPHLRERGLGQATATLTLRTTGIGESALAEQLGPLLDRGANPTIATYARADAVDVRISATPTTDMAAAAIVAAAEGEVLALIGDHVWGRGDVTWPQAIAAALDDRGWSLAVHESGLRGALSTLLAEGLDERLRLVVIDPGVDGRRVDGPDAVDPAGSGPSASPEDDLVDAARSIRMSSGADVGLAVRASTRHGDMAVTVSIVDPDGDRTERRLAFLAGPLGRSRAALVTAAILLGRIR